MKVFLILIVGFLKLEVSDTHEKVKFKRLKSTTTSENFYTLTTSHETYRPIQTQDSVSTEHHLRTNAASKKPNLVFFATSTENDEDQLREHENKSFITDSETEKRELYHENDKVIPVRNNVKDETIKNLDLNRFDKLVVSKNFSYDDPFHSNENVVQKGCRALSLEISQYIKYGTDVSEEQELYEIKISDENIKLEVFHDVLETQLNGGGLLRGIKYKGLLTFKKIYVIR